jgi:hypothetical protein|nr:MAG TPA: Putative tail fiber protein fold, Tail fiber, receptor [Caudoviricetes sp.]
MSILKGILHHWNKTNSAYDTIHPETEVAQVTDWNQGIVNTLASTALGTLVNTLTSDSLLATMIQKVLTATGVKYSMGQNGYFCFGSLFGGLIIQWGLADHSKSREVTVTLPLSITTFLQGTVSDTGSGAYSFGIAPNNASSIVVFSQTAGAVSSRWILLAI